MWLGGLPMSAARRLRLWLCTAPVPAPPHVHAVYFVFPPWLCCCFTERRPLLHFQGSVVALPRGDLLHCTFNTPTHPQASAATRSLLVHLKSTSRDGGLVSHLVEGLTLLYDTALEAHGEEGAPAAAAGGV